MRVSSRYAALIAAVAGGVMTAAATAASHAVAPPSPPPPHSKPCCSHPGGPSIRPPSIHIGGPSVHVRGPNIHFGGIHMNNNVNVNVTANASASASAIASGSAGAGAASTIFLGGGYVQGGTAPAATAVTGLRLAGSGYEMIEEERTRLVEEWRLVRAICVDDRGAPHPASRVDPGERVGPDYEGEIYRCMAGTAMQVTLGWREDGADRYEGATTIACEKGEALRHAPGGRLYCAAQEERRACNERSLLRLYGPGVKLIYVRYEESFMESYERRTVSSELSSMTLMLDGGVGGYR